MVRRPLSWIATSAALALVLGGLALWRCAGHTPDAGERAAPGPAARVSAPRARDPSTLARGAILGTVTTDAGAPLAGARVCASGASDELSDDARRAPTCASTDAAGRYELAGLPPARYTVSASAPGHRPAVHARPRPGASRPDARTRVVLAAGAREAGIDLVLRAGGVELAGVVLDVTGGPIAGARVRATSGDRGEPEAWTESGADGRFAISVAPGGARVTASAEGYAEGAATAEAPGSVEVLLTPESSLAGTIVDATGAPVEGARVTIASGEAFESAGGTVRSAADGTFRVARLTPGRYAVHAASRRGVGRSDGSVLVGLGQHVDGVVVRLSPAYRLEGTIVIAPGGERCTRGDLSLHDPERTLWIDTRRADDGTVYADGLLPGTYRVHAECEGYRSRSSYPAITIADADVTGQVWEVEPGATLRGRVRTRAGAPVEHATVSARSDSDAWARDETDAEGRYELVGLAAGTYRLQVDSRHGLAPRAAEAVVPKAGVVERDLVLEDGAVIAGTVVDTRGAPVPDVTVASTRSATGWGEEARTDARGAFRLPPQPPGLFHVVAQRANVPLAEPGAAGQGVRVTVQAGETTDVRLVVEPQTLAIGGVVLDARGAPVPDAFVAVARESGDGTSSIGATRWTWDERPVLTGTDGRFTVARLAAGAYTVRAFRKGGGEAVAEHVAAGSQARLQIKSVGSIEGVARRPGGAAGTIDELSIQLVDRATGFSREEQFLRSDGRFALRDLPAGAFTLTARARGALVQVPVALAEGEAKTGVTVELAGLVELTGRLVDLRTRAPIPDVRMMAALASSRELSFVPEPDRANVTDAAGRFTIRGAPTGRVAIRAWTRGSDYVLVHGVVTVAGSTDVGEIGLLRRRVVEGQPVGEHGIRWAEDPNPQTVASVVPRGPAARAGLVAGDVVVAIDGIDVRGDHGVRVPALCHAPPGTTLTFTLARGAIVPVTLAAP